MSQATRLQSQVCSACDLALRKLFCLYGFCSRWGLYILAFLHLTLPDTHKGTNSLILINKRNSVSQETGEGGVQINDDIPYARYRERISFRRFGLCCEWREREALSRERWGTLPFSLDSHSATQFWPFSNPPELLAEEMENQRKEHRPWAAVLAALQRKPRYLKANCSTFPRSPLAFQHSSTLWQKLHASPRSRGQELTPIAFFSMRQNLHC